jgi:hypothetical protein
MMTSTRARYAGYRFPSEIIWVDCSALRRAVRFGDGFTVPGANRDVYDRYVAELEKVNRPTDNLRFASGFWFLIVSNDPERTFAEAADHVIYQVNNYSVWLQAGGLQPLAPHLKDTRWAAFGPGGRTGSQQPRRRREPDSSFLSGGEPWPSADRGKPCINRVISTHRGGSNT